MYIYLGHGGSVRQRQVQAGGHHHQQVSLFFFHDALLLFILFKNALPLSAFTLFANRLLTNVLFALSLILPALLLSKKLNMINERLNLACHNPSPSSLFPTYSLAVNHVFPVQPASNPLLFLPLDSAISAVFLSHCSLFRYF